MKQLKKELTNNEIEAAKASMNELNAALKSKARMIKEPKLILWASDFHLHQEDKYNKDIDIKYESIDCSRQLQLCLSEINSLEMKPSALIFGGDITDNSFSGEWKEFKRIINESKINTKTLPLFGNHEHVYPLDKAEMRSIWTEYGLEGWHIFDDPNEYFYSTTIEGLRLIFIDTVKLEGSIMSDLQRRFLEEEIENCELPVVIFQHKHIMPASNWLDDGLYKDKGMADIISRSDNVLGVFSGHTHKTSLWHYMDKLYGSFPAVSYGIGDKTGWGGILIDGRNIAGIFVKDLTGETYDDCIGFQEQRGEFRFLNAESFERSPLLDPEFWYRSPQPDMRK